MQDRRKNCADARFALTLRAVLLSLAVSCAAPLLGACSSADDLPEQKVTITDPVDYEISGISGDLLDNVRAHLSGLAVISKKRVFFYRREIRDTASKALHAYGYYHPDINVILPDEKNDKDLTVRLEIDAGKPLFIRRSVVEILGEGRRYRAFSDIVKRNSLESYRILNHGAYEQLKLDVQNTALSLGFFDGRFISSRILVFEDQNAADIALVFDSGRRYRFGETFADDGTRALMPPVQSLRNFKEGDFYHSDTINSYINALNQTDYFRSVDVRPVVEKAKDGIIPVEMHLERRPNNAMRLGAGFTTDEGPRGIAEWDKPLLNDRGDSFSAMAKISSVTQNAQMVYKIPRNNPNLDYYTLNVRQQHTDINDTKSDLTHLSAHYIANMTGRWRRDYFLRSEYENYSQASEKDSAYNFMPGIKLTRRESSGGFDPRLGYSLSLEVLGGSSIIGDQSFMQVNAAYTGLTELFTNSRLLLKLRQGVNIGPDTATLPPSLRYFIGGDNSVRGFGYMSVSSRQADDSGLKGAKYMTTGTIEAQMPIGIPNSRLALFLDAGIATDGYGAGTEDDIVLGPGIGYRFASPYGAVRVDFAVGLQNDHEKNYRLHFAFGPEF